MAKLLCGYPHLFLKPLHETTPPDVSTEPNTLCEDEIQFSISLVAEILFGVRTEFVKVKVRLAQIRPIKANRTEV